MRSWTTLPLACLLSQATFSADGVLVEHLPPGANEAHVLAIAKQAFLRREWTIAASDEHSVTGTLDHREYDSRVKVYVAGQSLRYDDSGSNARRGGAADHRSSQHTIQTKSTAPQMWLDNLRLDISTMLASVPPPAAQPSVAERLKTLEELRAAGVLTELEYAQKRADILKTL